MVLHFNYTFTHDQHDDTALTLLLDLSDNFLKQFQNNTVVVQHEEIDRVGLFEPTTFAPQSHKPPPDSRHSPYQSTQQ